jgi:hypothetical protein
VIAAAEAGEAEDQAARRYIPSDLERALLCERTNWAIKPWDLDEIDVQQLRSALMLVHVYRAYQQYGRDLEKMTPDQAETVGWVESLKSLKDH